MGGVSFHLRFQKYRIILCAFLGLISFLSLYIVYHQLLRAVLLVFLFAVSSCVEIRIDKGSLAPLALPVLLLLSGIYLALTVQTFYFLSFALKLVYMPWVLLLNALVCCGLYLLVYGLSRNLAAAALVPVLLLVPLALVSRYVYEFRGSPLQFADLLTARTAANVVDKYTLFWNVELTTAILAAFALILVQLLTVRLTLPKLKALWGRVLCLAAGAVCFGLCLWGSAALPRSSFMVDDIYENGLLMDFMIHMQETLSYGAPEGYQAFDYSTVDTDPVAPGEGSRPHVLVVMSEAYGDFDIYSGSTPTSQPVDPFYDSLTENAVRGHALSSVFGGFTANSEYEFLTGNTLGFFPAGTVPFQQYVSQGDYSLVCHMEALGYRTVAMHPENPLNWMRETAWNHFGFDETLFLEDFPREDIVHSGVSDREFVEQILALLEQPSPEPLFLFGITMQNHGGYGNPYTPTTVTLEGMAGDYPDAEQYLSLIRLSDDALAYLVSRLEQLEEETVLLFFGDHQPIMEEAFLEELNGGPLDTLDRQQKKYIVPFTIWANFDIAEKEIPLTSLNYLGGHLMEAAGLPLSPYQQFLQDVEANIPALNAHGYLSGTGAFRYYSDAAGEDARLLQTYRILQYNSTQGEKRNPGLFPFPDA